MLLQLHHDPCNPSSVLRRLDERSRHLVEVVMWLRVGRFEVEVLAGGDVFVRIGRRVWCSASGAGWEIE